MKRAAWAAAPFLAAAAVLAAAVLATADDGAAPQPGGAPEGPAAKRAPHVTPAPAGCAWEDLAAARAAAEKDGRPIVLYFTFDG